MPYGVIYFKLNVKNPGNQAVVTIYFSEIIPQDAKWYKLDAANAEWMDFSDYAEIEPDGRSISLFLEDGGIGDADGVANGIIVDPSGLGIELSDVTSSGGGGGGCFIATVQPKFIPWLFILGFVVFMAVIFVKRPVGLEARRLGS
jgi:hypothetical protein